jgi:hypothetical protein
VKYRSGRSESDHNYFAAFVFSVGGRFVGQSALGGEGLPFGVRALGASGPENFRSAVALSQFDALQDAVLLHYRYYGLPCPNVYVAVIHIV